MLEDLLRILAAFSWHVTLIDVICLTWRITNTVYTILSVSIKFILFQFFFSLSLFLSCISFVSIRHQRHMYLISLPEEQTNVSEKKSFECARVHSNPSIEAEDEESTWETVKTPISIQTNFLFHILFSIFCTYFVPSSAPFKVSDCCSLLTQYMP